MKSILSHVNNNTQEVSIIRLSSITCFEDRKFPINSFTCSLHSDMIYVCYYNILSLHRLSLRERDDIHCPPYKVNHAAEIERIRRMEAPPIPQYAPRQHVGGFFGFFQAVASLLTWRPQRPEPPLPEPVMVMASEGKVYSQLDNHLVVYLS